MPKISVIMPVYNGEKYLREAIDSILNQTFSDFEFIIINDDSKDSTEEIIKSYDDNRIVYLKNEQNLGVAGTLNRGLDIAKGEYIARMDADDISMPQRFEKQVAYLDKNQDVGVLGSNVIVFTETEENKTEFPCNEKDVRIHLFINSQLAHPTVMTRRSLVEDGIYRYDSTWEGREDYELWTRIVQKSKICNLPEPLLRYRKHSLQVTKKTDGHKLEKHAVLKHKFLNEMGICVSLDEARIFSKYCVGIKEYTAYEFKVFSRIIDEIDKKYQAPSRFIKNIKKNVSIKKADKSAYIITCHDVYNYGASLQAYALQTFLEKREVDARIIDYQAPYLSKLFDFNDMPEKCKKNLVLKWLFRCHLLNVYIPAIPKYFRYKKFNKKYLKLTSEKFINNEQLRMLKPADMYFCGSDQIWNSYNYPCGKDPAFFLDFAPSNASKFSYAASFGSNRIDEDYSEFIKEKLSSFDAISVREKSGQAILESLNVSDVEFVVDPVFLLPQNEWSKLARKKIEKPYVLIYAFNNMEKAREIAKHIAFQNDFEIKEFAYGKSEYSSGPCEFLYLIKNAQYVVTNSFHAIAFSLIFEKQFWVVDRAEKELSERLDNILEIANLMERKIATLEDVINRYSDKINYSKVNILIEDFVNTSKSYIERCIEFEKGKDC